MCMHCIPFFMPQVPFLWLWSTSQVFSPISMCWVHFYVGHPIPMHLVPCLCIGFYSNMLGPIPMSQVTFVCLWYHSYMLGLNSMHFAHSYGFVPMLLVLSLCIGSYYYGFGPFPMFLSICMHGIPFLCWLRFSCLQFHLYWIHSYVFRSIPMCWVTFFCLWSNSYMLGPISMW